ncbi:hypothetical protein FQR65_LT20371 [Abscondita terminalis]|nr:hypothetical protein FQR65_LT20371 [Abscondita terminalis]
MACNRRWAPRPFTIICAAATRGSSKSCWGPMPAEVTAVVANAPGALELLASAEYRGGRSMVCSIAIKHGKVVKDVLDGRPRAYPQAGDPYEEIYKSSAWYGLVPEQNTQYLDMSGKEDEGYSPRANLEKPAQAAPRPFASGQPRRCHGQRRATGNRATDSSPGRRAAGNQSHAFAMAIKAKARAQRTRVFNDPHPPGSDSLQRPARAMGHALLNHQDRPARGLASTRQKERLMRNRCLLIVLGLLALSGCNSFSSSRSLSMDKSDWVTHCFGRFLIDLPPQAERWTTHPTEPGARIDAAQQELKLQQHDTKGHMFVRRVEHGNGSQKDSTSVIFPSTRRTLRVQLSRERRKKSLMKRVGGFKCTGGCPWWWHRGRCRKGERPVATSARPGVSGRGHQDGHGLITFMWVCKARTESLTEPRVNGRAGRAGARPPTASAPHRTGPSSRINKPWTVGTPLSTRSAYSPTAGAK